jgi:hypothetical protein
MNQFLIVMLVQLLLVLLCVIGGVAFFNYRRRHEEDMGAQMLVYHINSHKDLRVDSLATLIEKVYGSQGEELKNIVDQLYLKEADCYRELIQVFMNRDPKQLTKMYDAVQKITAAYEGMMMQLNSDKEPQINAVPKVDHSDNISDLTTPTNIEATASTVTTDATATSTPTATVTASATANTGATTETVAMEKKLNTTQNSSLNYKKGDSSLSTTGMEVSMEEPKLATTATTEDLAPANEQANSINDQQLGENAQAIDKAPNAPVATPIADILPSEQEMAYYQDKLMTYLESKEVSKASVTELLDKDNQQEVAK